jgi:hypothetical protein
MASILALTILFLFTPFSLACEPATLALVSGKAAEGESATVSFKVEGSELLATFNVITIEPNEKEKLAAGEYPYQFDVVEAFISVDGGLPYYEFELTPPGQILEVKILHPRKPFVNGLRLGMEAEFSRNAGGWSATMRIPLERLGWKGGKITGNAFAILGKKPARRFYALSLPAQEKPRFHLPQYFRPLAPRCDPK